MAALETRAEVVRGGDYYLCPLSARQVSTAERELLLAPVWSAEQALEVIYRIEPDGEQAEEIAEGFVYESEQQAALDGQIVSWTERRFMVRSLKLAASLDGRERSRPGVDRRTEV